jgi:predicted TIM-barrel fold metal-dependent hydrolase
LDRNRVDRAVIFASSPNEVAVVGAAVKSYPRRLYPYALVNPKAAAQVELVESLQSQFAFKGVLLFPALHEFSIQSPEAEHVINMAEKHRLVVFVHCGKLRIPVRKLIGLSADFPAERSRPRDLEAVAKAHPQVRFVVPHFGSGWFEETMALGDACPNVYVDTAGSNGWILAHDPPLALTQVFHTAKDVFGVDRILYGSDSGVFPGGYRGDVMQAQQQTMTAAGYTEDDRRAVMGFNLGRLLEI